MSLVRCLRFGTSKVHPLQIGSRCRLPKKVSNHIWIAQRCLSYSPARLNEQKAGILSEFADLTGDSLKIPDKELIDLTENNVDLLNTAEQLIQSATVLDKAVSASDMGLSPILLPRLFYDMICMLHETTTWAWVPSIAAACVMMRICTFPLYVNSRKEMSGFLHQMVNVQKDIMDFNPTGSMQKVQAEQKRAMNSMIQMQRSMPRLLMSPIASGMVFSSFYFCLRAMANHPIQSMQAESFLWVPSLTAADPYFLFPLLTASTMFLTMWYNMEAGVQLGSNMKYLYFGIPAVIFAVTCTMPANLTIYWFINNNITVLFFTICRQEKVKNYFQILDPPDLEHGKESKNDFMSFQKGFKESLQRLEKLHNIEERNQLTKKAEQDDIIKKANELKRLIEEHQRKNKRPD